MATHRLSILDRFLPDASGNVWWEPSSIKDTNDRYPHEVLIFKDSGTDISASAQFAIPKNYVGSAKLIIVWRANATSGDLRLAAALTPVGGDGAETMDPNADTDAPAAWTDTAPGTAMRRAETSVTLDSGDYAADDSCLVKLTRTGANAGDTLVADAIIEDVLFEYADA
jgi:putative transposon-encoded protein